MKRLPTKEEFEALLKFPYKWDEKRKGQIVTAENGNELFFPAFSCYEDMDILNESYNGDYWSATLDDTDFVWYLYLYAEGMSMSLSLFNYNLLIRLVSDELCEGFIDMGTGIYWSIENYKEGEKKYFTWNEAMKIPQK